MLAEDLCRLELYFLRGFAAILISFIFVLFVFFKSWCYLVRSYVSKD